MGPRDGYLNQLRARLDKWQAQIDALRDDAAHAEPQLRAELQKRIADLQQKCEAARRRIAEIRVSKSTAWEDLREGAEYLWDDIKQLLKETEDAYRQGRREGK